ncbi:MAG: SPOR domain-containing protein [Nitrospinaceae bacterium]|nr:MAG: SPOR domain-containing protein [Nitrospinaceae bacterium]
MNETGKTLTALFILGLAGVGAYSSGKWVLDAFNKLGEKPPNVVKKQSPVKPQGLNTPRADAPEEEFAAERYTFFETLGDSSMTKIAGLEGRILSKEEVAGRPEVPLAAPRPVVKAVIDRPEKPRKTPAAQRVESREEIARAVPAAAKPGREDDPLYAVQVSSFRDSDRARRLEDKLKHMGYEAFQLAAGGGEGGVRHRVYLGKYNDRRSADHAARQVRMKAALGGMVITLGR